MLNRLLPRRRWGSLRIGHGMVVCLSFALGLSVSARAQPQVSPKPGAPSKSSDEDAQDADRTKPAATAPDAAAPATEVADPSQTRKIVANEIFRDPKVEKLKLLDINKFQHVVRQPVPNNDLEELKAMAGGANPNVDRALIDRVVDAQVSKLTDHANIQALIDPPPQQKMNSPSTRAIQDATAALLKPLFEAKSAKNQAFLTVYNRVLLQKLTPLLKNHLIPRIQAMIILGQSGSLDLLQTYESQIKDKDQTIWVKLWALEGIVNIIEGGGPPMTGQAQVDAAKIVADFLEKEDDIPWPAQLRALEAMSALRRGFHPNRASKAEMANVVMQLLADSDSKLEVRAEAARALGLMQISTAVPKYNYDLVAHTVGLLAAELGAEIGTLWPSAPVKAAAQKPSAKTIARSNPAKAAPPSTPAKPAVTTNRDKANYFAALLVGPVFQAFDGAPGLRDAGLLHSTGGEQVYSEKVFALIKAVAKVSIELIQSGSSKVDLKKKELADQVAVLRDFLEKNAPADRHLVPDGPAFPLPEAQAPSPAAQAQPADPNPK